jgi:hypothetical protein
MGFTVTMGGDRNDEHVGISAQGETEPRAKRPFDDKHGG